MKTKKFQNYSITEIGSKALVYYNGKAIAMIQVKTSRISFTESEYMSIEEMSDLMDFVNDFYGADSK